MKEVIIMKASKAIERAVAVLCALFLLWGTVSFIEVNIKNKHENPQYWEHNMFVYFIRLNQAGE